MKKCRTCQEEKHEHEFSLRSPDKNGNQYFRSDCKQCCKVALKEFKQSWDKSEKGKAYKAEYQRRYLKRLRELAELGKQAEKARKAASERASS